MNWESLQIAALGVVCGAVGFWLGKRSVMSRIQHHSIPLDQFGRMDFTFTPRASLAIIDSMAQAGLIQPIPNEKNRLILSEWPAPPESSV